MFNKTHFCMEHNMASFFNNDVPKISPESTGVGLDAVEEMLTRPLEKLQAQLDVMVGVLTSQGKLDAVQDVNHGSEVIATSEDELQEIVSEVEEVSFRSTPGGR